MPCGLFLVAVSRGSSLVEVLGFLIVVASLVAEHRLQSMQGLAVAALGLVVVAPRLQNTSSEVVGSSQTRD